MPVCKPPVVGSTPSVGSIFSRVEYTRDDQRVRHGPQQWFFVQAAVDGDSGPLHRALYQKGATLASRLTGESPA